MYNKKTFIPEFANRDKGLVPETAKAQAKRKIASMLSLRKPEARTTPLYHIINIG